VKHQVIDLTVTLPYNLLNAFANTLEGRQVEKTNTKNIVLEVADDGTVTIPSDLTHALRLSPHQTVTAEVRDDTLIVKPSPKQRMDRIGHLLRATLAGVEWSEIEAERQDRWF
jgi:antitoxin component of MazEF toxin-antitoxin module